MKRKLSYRLSMVLVVACAVCVLTVGVALAAGTWADEIANAVTFYKASYPTSNFDPYLKQLARVRDGLGREDQQIVKVEMDHFLKMLQTRAHGINEVAADELYNFALGVIPQLSPQENTAAAIDKIELGGTMFERLMSVPEHLANTHDDGRTPCVGFKDGGCDYWIDFMDDNSGG